MIRRIELVNFMSHARTAIEPAEGLTVLVGPNNCGKSAVVAALQILCHNETSTYVMRHGERECSITVETDDGHTVTWRRKKSPAYFLDGAELSRLERSEVPKEVTKALRLPVVTAEGDRQFDVHFGEQKSPVFLLDKSGSHAAQFFASSSDAASLVEMQRRHQQKMADARKERGRLEADAQRLAKDLTILSEADPVGMAIEEAEARHAEIGHAASAASQLADDLGLLAESQGRLDRTCGQTAALRPLLPPPAIEPAEPLSELIGQLGHWAAAAEFQAALAAALDPASPPPVLADEHPLLRLAGDLAQTEQIHERHVARYDAVAALPALPEMADASQLAAAAREIGVLLRHGTLVDEQAAALGALGTPPELRSESALANDLGQLTQGVAWSAHTDALYERLAFLPVLPALADTFDLQRLVASHREAVAVASAHEREAASAAEAFRLAEATLHDWAARNPVCPTCGGAVDLARLAEHARAHGREAHA